MTSPSRLFKGVEVADFSLVAAFAEKLGSLAMRAGFRRKRGCKLDMNGSRSSMIDLKGVVSLQA